MKLENKYDFVYLFDVQDGNPNGDPDDGNSPRLDAESGRGIVTDVCLKRKVRNYIQMVKDLTPPYDIFIREKSILNNTIGEVYDSVVDENQSKNEKTETAREAMCARFYDVRAFGAVMSTGSKNAGQVRGPIQMTFATSIDPVVVRQHCITRMAVTSEEKSRDMDGLNMGMGRKSDIPYGLYMCKGFVSANFAFQTGFSTEDLNLFWDALKYMFEDDRSSTRGFMSPRKLIVFCHDSKFGNAYSGELFNLVKVNKKCDGSPRSFADYEITIDKKNLPKGVSIQEII